MKKDVLYDILETGKKLIKGDRIMRKKNVRFFAMLLTISILMASLPMNSLAADKTIKKLELVIPLPEAGMTMDEYKNSLKLQEANTEYGDLTAMGELTEIRMSNVNGDFDRTDPSNQKYIAGNTYQIIVKPIFTNSSYLLPHDANFTLIPSKFTITVNGIEAETTPYAGVGAPGVMFSYTIPKGAVSQEEQDESDAEKKAENDARHNSLRKIITDSYTVEEADERWIEKQERDVCVVTGDIKSFNYDALGTDKDFITKLIFDVTSDDSASEKFWGAKLVMDLPNLKEIWLGEGVDPVEFCKGTMSESAFGLLPISNVLGYTITGVAFAEGDATLYVPSTVLDKKAAMDAFPKIYPQFPYTIKLYDGDVRRAEKTGNGYEWCTNHSYSTLIGSRDRVCQYPSCNMSGKVYYSCEYCGKCEYDDNHTIAGRESYPCRYYAMIASDEAYVGEDIYGNHLFWYSCMYCSRPKNTVEANPTVEDWKMSGVDLSYEQYSQYCKTAVKQTEERALISVDFQIDMFPLSAKTDAKVSVWAQDGVNQALDNNLVDTSLMGNDYTKSITRLQFCSVAVKLAQELTGKSIKPADAKTFSDTDNIYVLKAYAAGITSGTGDGTFSPDATLDRQQMATFIYRTLQYIKANSDIKYTPYDSKLASYEDNGEIASWAKDALAFMNALDLIKGTSDTTISPTAKCTIEQALIVAGRSVYADSIGWYQVKSYKENKNFIIGNHNERYWFGPNYGNDVGVSNLIHDKRIWVTGRRIKGDYSYLTTPDPYTGQIFFVLAEWLRPIRE